MAANASSNQFHKVAKRKRLLKLPDNVHNAARNYESPNVTNVTVPGHNPLGEKDDNARFCDMLTKRLAKHRTVRWPLARKQNTSAESDNAASAAVKYTVGSL